MKLYKATIHKGYANEWSVNILSPSHFDVRDAVKVQFLKAREVEAKQEWSRIVLNDALLVEDTGVEAEV